MQHLPQVIVKASVEHASIGMDAGSVVPGIRVVREVEDRARRFATPFFAEAYVEGREFNLSLLDGPHGPIVLPPAEIIFVDYPPDRPKIVDYDAKWVEGAFGFANTPRVFDFVRRGHAATGKPAPTGAAVLEGLRVDRLRPRRLSA